MQWRRARGFELGRSGLDSVKPGKVICDFNKAEGLTGISCLGDGGLEMDGNVFMAWRAKGQAGALGRSAHPSPTRSRALLATRVSQPLQE